MDRKIKTGVAVGIISVVALIFVGLIWAQNKKQTENRIGSQAIQNTTPPIQQTAQNPQNNQQNQSSEEIQPSQENTEEPLNYVPDTKACQLFASLLKKYGSVTYSAHDTFIQSYDQYSHGVFCSTTARKFVSAAGYDVNANSDEISALLNKYGWESSADIASGGGIGSYEDVASYKNGDRVIVFTSSFEIPNEKAGQRFADCILNDTDDKRRKVCIGNIQAEAEYSIIAGKISR